MIALPFAFVMVQPDLGTALSIAIGGVAVMFLAGVPLWLFIGGGAERRRHWPPSPGISCTPTSASRVSIFLDPESDPLGAGYHITQSKIAIGSGGIFGKGPAAWQPEPPRLPARAQHRFYLSPPCSRNGACLAAYSCWSCFAVILGWGVRVAMQSQGIFSRLGRLRPDNDAVPLRRDQPDDGHGSSHPVVGIPLPLVSWGGSAMMTVLLALGIVFSLARERGRTYLGEGPRAL